MDIDHFKCHKDANHGWSTEKEGVGIGASRLFEDIIVLHDAKGLAT